MRSSPSGVCYNRVLADQWRRFLKKRGTIEQAQVDLELCLLSVAYLNLPDFDLGFPQSSVMPSLLSGRYAFLEYAVACWVLHLESWLDSGKPVQSSIDELQDMLEPFLQQHLVQGDGSGLQSAVPKTMYQKLQPFRLFELYDSLSHAVIWSKKQYSLDSGGDSRTTNVLDLPDVTSRIRSTFEDMARDGFTAQQTANLKLYYGSSQLFKCPKMFCRHFIHGFASLGDRDRHLNRHERAYTCTFEGCPTATFGCLTLKELERHMLESHGILKDSDEFPRVSRPDITPAAQMTERHVFQCSQCPKRFTRTFNLRAHGRTHTNERPYPCPVCGMAFVRAHDQATHTRRQCSEKTFRCRGSLETGSRWGCGRGFSTAADFARHLSSARGRRCVRPLAAQQRREEAEGAARREAEQYRNPRAYQQSRYLWPSNPQLLVRQVPVASSPSPTSSDGGAASADEDAMEVDAASTSCHEEFPQTFPRALVAQYPALAAFDS